MSEIPSTTPSIRIHPEGWLFIFVAAIITFLLAKASCALGWIGFGLTGWVAYFFRDPQRVTPSRKELVVSPADGIVTFVGSAEPPKELELGKGEWTRVSIFLNVFNVHVNRIPLAGTIIKSHYRPGKFLNATLDKSSEDNERQSFIVESEDKVQIPFVQIAGLIARRIRRDVNEGDVVKTGQRFGLIRFGSRVDVYLPKGVSPLVCMGQIMIAGETVLADLSSKEKQRFGEVR